MKLRTIVFVLFISVLLKLFLLYESIDGCAEIANGRIGVLTQDTEVGYFDGKATVFTLPQGLIVRDASAIGPGWFEAERFRIIITSNNKSLVDYSNNKDDLGNKYSEYYSTEIKNGTDKR